MKYYTDCDCFADHWKEFDSFEEALADFKVAKKDCNKKTIYKENELGIFTELTENIVDTPN